jgi:hypothetical protein
MGFLAIGRRPFQFAPVRSPGAGNASFGAGPPPAASCRLCVWHASIRCLNLRTVPAGGGVALRAPCEAPRCILTPCLPLPRPPPPNPCPAGAATVAFNRLGAFVPKGECSLRCPWLGGPRCGLGAVSAGARVRGPVTCVARHATSPRPPWPLTHAPGAGPGFGWSCVCVCQPAPSHLPLCPSLCVGA